MQRHGEDGQGGRKSGTETSDPEHRDQSQDQIHRLEQVFEAIGKRARGKTCTAMEGLSEEVDEAVEEGEKGPVLDAALIACAQAIEHYEMARYGAMVAWARTMGLDDAAELLSRRCEEEKASDQAHERDRRAPSTSRGSRRGGEESGEDEDGEGGARRGGARKKSG